MTAHTHKPWPSLIVSLLGVAVGASYLTKAVGVAKSGTDLLIGILCLVLGLASLIALCQRWNGR